MSPVEVDFLTEPRDLSHAGRIQRSQTPCSASHNLLTSGNPQQIIQFFDIRLCRAPVTRASCRTRAQKLCVYVSLEQVTPYSTIFYE
jgi:hypothetical protein